MVDGLEYRYSDRWMPQRPPDPPTVREDVVQWYLKVLGQYADFSGRARRTEFWMFVLVNVLVHAALVVIDGLLGLTQGLGVGLLAGLYQLAVLVPVLAVGARRLHDTGRSGWWQLLWLVPLVGTIVLVVFWASEGTRAPNAHGADPKRLATDSGRARVA